jgi:hypothetical protein
MEKRLGYLTVLMKKLLVHPIMVDTTFRSSTIPVETAPRATVDPKVTQTTSSEVPYLDFETEHGKPFVVDYFQLGDRWMDETGGFSKEVGMIESYFKDQVDSGELPNSVEAVKEAIKKMEKFTNVPKEERTVMKLETLSHYVEFLRQCAKTKFNLKHYSSVK